MSRTGCALFLAAALVASGCSSDDGGDKKSDEVDSGVADAGAGDAGSGEDFGSTGDSGAVPLRCVKEQAVL